MESNSIGLVLGTVLVVSTGLTPLDSINNTYDIDCAKNPGNTNYLHLESQANLDIEQSTLENKIDELTLSILSLINIQEVLNQHNTIKVNLESGAINSASFIFQDPTNEHYYLVNESSDSILQITQLDENGEPKSKPAEIENTTGFLNTLQLRNLNSIPWSSIIEIEVDDLALNHEEISFGIELGGDTRYRMNFIPEKFSSVLQIQIQYIPTINDNGTLAGQYTIAMFDKSSTNGALNGSDITLGLSTTVIVRSGTINSAEAIMNGEFIDLPESHILELLTEVEKATVINSLYSQILRDQINFTPNDNTA